MKIRHGSVLEMSFVLSEASIVCQIKRQELTVGFCSSKWLPQGKWEILSPSRETYLHLVTLYTPLDYLYLVSVLRRVGTFRIFECGLEHRYKAKQLGKKAH